VRRTRAYGREASFALVETKRQYIKSRSRKVEQEVKPTQSVASIAVFRGRTKRAPRQRSHRPLLACRPALLGTLPTKGDPRPSEEAYSCEYGYQIFRVLADGR
jgi:hypothetical protein